jgi:endonuclease YncB( thermonuclease family)
MKYLDSLRLVLFVLLISTSTYSQKTLTAKVVGIKDGDTVVVLDSLHYQTTLRLAEVDTPEKSQPFGTKAKQFTSDQVYLKTIKYVVTDTDRYGRSIAMIYYDSDNKYLSAEIIKAGMGWHYKRYSTSITLANFETKAKKDKTGLWVDNNPIAPWEWRRK